MKIIRVIERCPSLKVDFHPDSAMISPGRPMFMPDWGEGWCAVVYVAAKICRLGKNISRKFAGRYYDSVSVVLRAVLPEVQLDAGVLSGMDSTIVHGEWLDKALVSDPMIVDGGTGEVTLEGMDAVIDDVVSAVSVYSTLKIGDIIILPVKGMELPLGLGCCPEIKVNGATVLELRVV